MTDAYPKEFLLRNQPPLDRLSTTTRCKGFHAIVTGGASGIGRAIVERFINDGANRVAIFDINEKLAMTFLGDLKANGIEDIRVQYYKVNVGVETEVQAAVAEFAQNHCDGKLDALITCAARFTSLSFGATDDNFLATYRVNVLGAVYCVRASRPFLKKHGDETSSIVLFSSTAGFVAQKQRWTYAAAKGAINSLTKDMALDLVQDNIRVNAVVPGYVWSPVEKMVSKDGTRESMSYLTKPAAIISRDSLVSEIAAVTVFLCCRDAAVVTGCLVRADGGYLSLGPDSKSDSSLDME